MKPENEKDNGNASQQTDQNTPPSYNYAVRLYAVDNDDEQKVANAYFIGCPTAKHRDALYEIIQRIMQIMTIREFK